MSTPLLSTKLHIPASHSLLVPRPNLIDLLNHGSQTKLTLISAPTGYGKTTLLGQWLADCSLPVAWLTLDKADNDPVRFLSYLIAALQRIEPDLGIDVLDALQSVGVASGRGPSPLAALLTQFLNEIAAIRHSFFLILDDYHLVESGRIHEIVAYILDNQPAPLHLVIATRVDPPLPIARLRAQAQLVELRAVDLCFTLREASAFLNDVMGLALPMEQVDALEKRTEGWVAGLQLAGLSMQTHEDKTAFIEAFTGSHHYIMDYLLDEVLNRQSDLVREFLLRTSILERMTGTLCDALTGGSDGQFVLEHLEQSNLFIVPLDEQHHWYRYHQLLADVLQSRLQQFHPEILPELHQRASEWFEANGFLEHAIRHAVSGGDLEKTAGLIEQNAMSMLMHGELVTLLNWIQPIEEIIDDRPWLCTYKSWALTLSGQLDQVENWLKKAEHAKSLLHQNNAVEFAGHIEAIRAYVASVRGEIAPAIEHAQKALEALPENNQAVRSVVTFTLGSAFRIKGDRISARQALKAARRAASQAGNRYLELGAVSSLADLTYDEGKLHQSFEIYKEMLQLATPSGRHPLPPAGMALFGLGLIHYEWNELNAAEQNTQMAIKLCQRWGHLHTLAASFVLLSRVKQAQGDLDGAQQAIHKAEELTRIHALALRVVSWVTAFQVGLWLAQGNLEAAIRWAEESDITRVDDFSYLREAEFFALGRVFLATEKYDQVLELTRMLQDTAEATGRIGSLIETFVLQALAFQVKNDFPQALTSLERALTLAQPEGYIRVFVHEGALMADLLRRAGTQGIEAQFVAKLLSKFDQIAESPDAAVQPLIEPLSKRELEVLQLLADGLSNLEIADKLVITIGTVKAHTASIYRKLNVNSRTQAAARARELGLL
jgi:LuxR family maltose regulon positive regulatory protein